MSYKAIVFDWDGTLVDSESHIVDCIGYAADQLGLAALSYDRRKSIIGLGMREALLELYPELDHAQIVAMREHYAAHFFGRKTEPYDLFPGVLDTLEALKSKGVSLAVATGKSRNGLDKALQSTGLGRFFDIERCADETRSKPDPLMLKEIAAHYQYDYKDMLMVGDTSYDMSMAQQVNMPAVAVSYGVHALEDLHPYQPVKVIDALPVILELV